MAPATLPPATLEDALRVDLQRGQIVYSPGMSARVDGIFVGCPAAEHEQHRPHGGEPDLRVVRGTAANSLTSVTLSGTAATGVHVVIVHESWASMLELRLVTMQGTAPFTHPALAWRKGRNYVRVACPVVPAPRAFRVSSLRRRA